MTDSEESCANEPAATTFYKLVAAFRNYVVQAEDPIQAFNSLVDQYRPDKAHPQHWRTYYTNLLIDRWIYYSQEIQAAMPNPTRPRNQRSLAYRDTIEDLLTNGQWHPESAKPFRPRNK